jgi:hypothetical protein
MCDIGDEPIVAGIEISRQTNALRAYRLVAAPLLLSLARRRNSSVGI